MNLFWVFLENLNLSVRVQKHGWHRKYEVYKDTQQKFLVKHIHPFKIISRALIRDLIYALWLCLSRKSFCLTLPVLLSQNFWWFWASFAESIRMCDNYGVHPHGQKRKIPVLHLCVQSPVLLEVVQPRALPGVSFRTELQVHQCHCPFCSSLRRSCPVPGAVKTPLVSHSKLPSSLSGFYRLLPRRCPLLELYMIVWYVEPNVSPG